LAFWKGNAVVLLLSDRDVMRAVSGPDAVLASIDLIEQCFADAGRGEAAMLPRAELLYPPQSEARFGSQLSLQANMGIVPSARAIGGRIFTTGPGRAPAAGERPARRHGAWKLLWDFESQDLLCLMEDSSVHPYLVGAHVGVATRWLARDDARTVAVIGTGRMARGTLRAMCAVRKVTLARVYSPTPEHRRAFAEEATRAFGIEAVAVDSAEEAVRGADIVSCATNTFIRSREPVFAADWLSPGAFVSSIAAQELEEATLLRARVIPAHHATVLESRPPFEPFVSLARRGAIPAAQLPGDLSQVVLGQIPARLNPDDITVYVGPSLGYQHAALVRWVYTEAHRQGIGHEWDPES
jgi:ornithine cyclodeaminase/alanine dehydrogenase-like protein (mu-crystallin family)